MPATTEKGVEPGITILMDNQADPGLQSEHGLAMWIEADGGHILFDTGQSTALLANADALGIDLTKTDSIVISHGHYDHTGGLAAILRLSPHARLYIHPGAYEPRYSVREAAAKSIAMSSRAKASALDLPLQQINWVFRPCRPREHVGITGPIPRITDFEDTGGPFFFDRKGQKTDPIIDDMALWVRTPRGLVICLGCCHAGLVNTVDYIRQVTGETRIRAIIGGMHLGHATERRLEETVRHLARWDVETILPCHCTGEQATRFLQANLGDRIVPVRAGDRWPRGALAPG